MLSFTWFVDCPDTHHINSLLHIRELPDSKSVWRPDVNTEAYNSSSQDLRKLLGQYLILDHDHKISSIIDPLITLSFYVTSSIYILHEHVFVALFLRW